MSYNRQCSPDSQGRLLMPCPESPSVFGGNQGSSKRLFHHD